LARAANVALASALNLVYILTKQHQASSMVLTISFVVLSVIMDAA
jgi:hypothetical protein